MYQFTDVPTLNVPTQIQFNYFVSSEANYDILKFSVNGQEIQRWSGTSMTGEHLHTHLLFHMQEAIIRMGVCQRCFR